MAHAAGPDLPLASRPPGRQPSSVARHRCASTPPQAGRRANARLQHVPSGKAGLRRAQAPSGPHPAQPSLAREHASGVDPQRGRKAKQDTSSTPPACLAQPRSSPRLSSVSPGHVTTLRDLANRPRLQADGLVEHLDCSTGEITYVRVGSDQDGELWKQHRIKHLRSLVGCYQAETGRTMTPREDAAWEAILAEAIADAMNAGADGQDIQAATA
jgi:hypothetical protein